MIECSQKVRSVCPYRKTCGGGVYKEGSACDKFAESLQNKKAHKPGGGSITREQVEKMRGEWKIIEYEFFTCSGCWDSYYSGAESTAQAKSYLNSGHVYDFCPHCGAPMTDKAVDILWKRLEEVHDAAD